MKQSVIILGLLIATVLQAQDDENIAYVIKGHGGKVLSAAFSNDDSVLVTSSEDKTVKFWKLPEVSKPIMTIPVLVPSVRALNFTPRGDYLVGAVGKDIYMWDKNGKVYKTLKGHNTDVWSIAISIDGKRMVSGGYDRKFRLWNMTEGKLIKDFEGHEKNTLAVAITHNNQYIASGSLDKKIKLWQMKNYEPYKEYDGHTDNVYDICFLPGDTMFASTSRDKSVRIWGVDTGVILKTFVAHTEGVISVDVSPDGKYLLTGSFDKTIRLWDISTCKNIFTGEAHNAPVNYVKFSHDGKYFVSASDDKTAVVWYMDKRYVVEYYYADELEKEINATFLFKPKKSDESKSEYAARQEKAKKFKKQLIEKYYQQLQQMPDSVKLMK